MHSGSIRGETVKSFVVNQNANRRLQVQQAVMKNVSFDKTNSHKALGRTEAAMSNVESRDFGEERVTSCDSITWFSLLWRKKNQNRMF